MAGALQGCDLAWLGPCMAGARWRLRQTKSRKSSEEANRRLAEGFGTNEIAPKTSATGHWSSGTDWNLLLIPEIFENPDYLRIFNLEISSKYLAGSFLRT